MELDRYTHEKLTDTRIAEDQRFAQTLRALERVEGNRQAQRSVGSRWLSRLFGTLATCRIPNLNAL